MSEKKEYLGDGVYIAVENGMFKLTTEDGIRATNTIFLEPEVYKALARYAGRLDPRFREVKDAEVLADLERLAKMEEDIVEAAGNLMVDVPEPGTDAARLMIVNRLLKAENERLASHLKLVEKVRDDEIERLTVKDVAIKRLLDFIDRRGATASRDEYAAAFEELARDRLKTEEPEGEFIVELEPGVWVDDVRNGDPGRTLVKRNAEVFETRRAANEALYVARTMRPFTGARIVDTGGGECDECEGKGVIGIARHRLLDCEKCEGLGRFEKKDVGPITVDDAVEAARQFGKAGFKIADLEGKDVIERRGGYDALELKRREDAKAGDITEDDVAFISRKRRELRERGLGGGEPSVHCPDCGGTGIHFTEKVAEPCERCKGEGKV